MIRYKIQINDQRYKTVHSYKRRNFSAVCGIDFFSYIRNAEVQIGRKLMK